MIDAKFFKKCPPISLSEICKVLGLGVPQSLSGDSLFVGLAPLNRASPQHISCYHNSTYLKDLAATKAGLCLVREGEKQQVPPSCLALVTPNPYRDFAKLAALLYKPEPLPVGISPNSIVHPSAKIGKNCFIAPFSIIESGVVIGDNCFIGPHCVLQQNISLGNNCRLESHINISYSIIGNDVIIKSGAQIGQPGFGFAMDEAGHIDIPQLGRVLIGNQVYIGANTTIDRGSFADTLIGNGVRIDNLVQIAHNVEIGDHSIIVAQAGVAGSSKLGKFVVLAGQVGIAGHLKIGDGVKVSAKSGVMRDIDSNQTFGGFPAVSIREWHRQTLLLKRLNTKTKSTEN